jgi:DNA-binding transcriptional ArsR family regulator
VASLLAHPIRREILKALAREEPACAADLSRALGIPVGNVSYHFGVLRDQGCIEEVGLESRRGTFARFYARTETVAVGMEDS